MTNKLQWKRHTYDDGTTAYWRTVCGRFKIEPYFGPIIEHGTPSQRHGWWLLESDCRFEYQRDGGDPMSLAQAKAVAQARWDAAPITDGAKVDTRFGPATVWGEPSDEGMVTLVFDYPDGEYRQMFHVGQVQPIRNLVSCQ